MPDEPRDAVRVPDREAMAGRWQRARHTPVWVRVDGAWRAGSVLAWRRMPDGVWVAWTALHTGDTTSAPMRWLVADERAFRPRDEYDDTPPAG